MNLISLNPYRTTPKMGHRARVDPPASHETAPSHGTDRVTLSAAASEPKRNGKKMALFGAIGTALGLAAASVVVPGAGLGALLVGGLVGGVGGAAIADGALTEAGTRPARPFDPYNPSDILDPWNMTHPRNPFNPLNFPK